MERAFSLLAVKMSSGPNTRDSTLSAHISQKLSKNLDLRLIFGKGLPFELLQHLDNSDLLPSPNITSYHLKNNNTGFFQDTSTARAQQISLSLMKLMKIPDLRTLSPTLLGASEHIQEFLTLFSSAPDLSFETVQELLVKHQIEEKYPSLDIFKSSTGITKYHDVFLSIDDCFVGSVFGSVPFPPWTIIFTLVLTFPLPVFTVEPVKSLTTLKVKSYDSFYFQF